MEHFVIHKLRFFKEFSHVNAVVFFLVMLLLIINVYDYMHTYWDGYQGELFISKSNGFFVCLVFYRF